jgi:hypothetical protein
MTDDLDLLEAELGPLLRHDLEALASTIDDDEDEVLQLVVLKSERDGRRRWGLWLGLSAAAATQIVVSAMVLDRRDDTHPVIETSAPTEPALSTTTTSATVPTTAATPVNRAPVARPDAASTTVGASVRIAPLANDTDADGDALVITSASGATSGAVTVMSDGTVEYLPNGGFARTDVVTYTVSDGRGGTATATLTVVVVGEP